MSIRIYTPLPLEQASLVMLDSIAAHHLATVLRKKPGFLFHLFNGSGAEFSAKILRIEKRGVEVEVIEHLHTETVTKLRLHLLIALSKGERMDFALQKAVELGVNSITPIISERTVVRLSAERLERKMDHWRKIIIAACEQSGRSLIPALMPIQSVDQTITSPPSGLSILLDHRSEQSLSQLDRPLGDLNLIVGPEGGLSANERQGLIGAGFSGIHLGPRVLRTETAPLAALAAIQTLWGDF
ncbi:MAG: 16S rRNA (uracil(1498)-N(3))-methyltransferase [Candidatus Polarisedimenticolaceae bacterium]|nr:16S rRNA (uracil(1498)-N(3))-methyltransferase [Candidatus Polarisedimenticolaceae bacterium]